MSHLFATTSGLNDAAGPFRRRGDGAARLHTGRYRCRYFVWGSARPPLVFVHGLSDQARSFAMVMARLVDAGFRCVGYELPNGLDDGANLGMLPHPRLVADLIALLDHLKIDQADLLGSSFGTTVALAFAGDAPRAVPPGRPQGRVRPAAAAVDRARPGAAGPVLAVADGAASRLPAGDGPAGRHGVLRTARRRSSGSCWRAAGRLRPGPSRGGR